MKLFKTTVSTTGLLILLTFVAGILSVAPAIDSDQFLTAGAAHSKQVSFAILFQIALCFLYIGVAILLYPYIKGYNEVLSLGFVAFRIVAVSASVFGIVILSAILVLSERYSSSVTPSVEVLGNVLKVTRDYVNHVFMILPLCTGNIMLYVLLVRSRLIPTWMSYMGIISAGLSILASILILFGAVEVITTAYLLLNAPTVVQELILGFLLLTRGFARESV